jgi:hypothetical protein
LATKLFLRLSTTNGITLTGETVYDMVTTAGAGVSGVQPAVATTAGGTELQLFDTTGLAVAAWISGRAPVGGFTLTNTDVSGWFSETNMSANAGGRYRVFKYSGGVVTELGGGPFSDGVECSVFPTVTEMTWIGNVTDTAFAEDDRILVRLYATNVGTMGGGFTVELQIDGADGTTGDSFFNIAETVTFKAEGGGGGAAPISPYYSSYYSRMIQEGSQF